MVNEFRTGIGLTQIDIGQQDCVDAKGVALGEYAEPAPMRTSQQLRLGSLPSRYGICLVRLNA